MRAMVQLAVVSFVAVVAVAVAITSVPAPVEARRPQVAIIGGGIGGAATAHFLRHLVGDRVAIHVYEKHHVGGRLKSTVQIEGLTHELGGSMVYEDNYHVRAMADDVQLKRVDPSEETGLEDNPFALFDGTKFVFNQSSWTAVNLYRMYMRYGTAPYRFQSKPRAMFELFKGIYDLQANGTSFHSPEDLLKRVGLYDLTQKSTRLHLAEELGTDEPSWRFETEFVASVNRVNYNQENTINALAGMVSMLPAMDSRIFKIKGGNQHLPQRLLQEAGVHMKEGWAVLEVRPAKGNRLELHSRRQRTIAGGAPSSLLKWDQEVAGPYDAVVVATPLEHSHIRFHGVGVRPPPHREFQKVSTTFVAGRLRASYFNVSVLPADQVLTTEHAGTPFSVVSPVRRLPSGATLYKLFSHQPLGKHLLAAMFHDHKKVAHQDWYAYPQFKPPEKFAPFRLAPGIFYNNAFENAASAMEMSAIAAKNSALLVMKHLTSQDLTGALAAEE